VRSPARGLNRRRPRQITRLRERVAGLSAFQRKAAAARIMTRVSEAYGEMMLTEGLFQADAHPGNILVMPGAPLALTQPHPVLRARRPGRLSAVVLGGCSALAWWREQVGAWGVLAWRLSVGQQCALSSACIDSP